MASNKNASPAKSKNEQVEYYPIKTMMNGAATALFVAITVLFPFVMDMVYQTNTSGNIIFSTAKYGNITITKKQWFFGIAIIGCIIALFCLLLSYSTKPASRRSAVAVTIPERKGIDPGILDVCSRVRTVALAVTAVCAAAYFIVKLFSVSFLPLVWAFCISGVLAAIAYAVCHFGAPRVETVTVKNENAFTRFLKSLTLPDVAILLYWFFMVISAMQSDSPMESIIGLEKRNNGVFIQTLYIAVYFIISRGLIFKKSRLYILALSGTAVSVVAILHYFGIDLYETSFDTPRWLVEMYQTKTARNNAGTNFLGSVGNINLLSYIIVICFAAEVLLYIVNALPKWDKYGIFTLSCCFVMSFGEKCTRTDAGIVAIIGAAFFTVIILCNSMERLRRICIGFGVSALGWCLHLFLVKHHLQKISVDTTSKALFCGGVILLAAGIILTLFADKVDKVNGKIVRYSAWGVMAFGVIAVCALAVIAAKTQTSGTFYEFGQILMGNFDEKFGNSRGKIWMWSVHLIDENPLFGIGPDRFSTIFSEKLGTIFKGKVLDKAHNEYLDVLICNGIIGLGTFMTFLVGLLVRTVRHSKVCRCAGVMAVVIFAYMVHAFFGYQLPLQSPVVWAVLGLAGAACFADPDTPEPVFVRRK